eukprot:1382470-Rhodomonas_salina.1
MVLHREAEIYNAVYESPPRSPTKLTQTRPSPSPFASCRFERFALQFYLEGHACRLFCKEERGRDAVLIRAGSFVSCKGNGNLHFANHASAVPHL